MRTHPHSLLEGVRHHQQSTVDVDPIAELSSRRLRLETRIPLPCPDRGVPLCRCPCPVAVLPWRFAKGTILLEARRKLMISNWTWQMKLSCTSVSVVAAFSWSIPQGYHCGVRWRSGARFIRTSSAFPLYRSLDAGATCATPVTPDVWGRHIPRTATTCRRPMRFLPHPHPLDSG